MCYWVEVWLSGIELNVIGCAFLLLIVYLDFIVNALTNHDDSILYYHR